MKRSLFAFMMISINCFATQLPFSSHPFGVPATDESLTLISEKLEMPSILQSGQVPVLNQGGAGALSITGANSFDNITNSVQPATVTFPDEEFNA